MWFGMRRVPGGGYACLLPRNVMDKVEFYRAKIKNQDLKIRI
jgi:hypothetical protein